MTKAYSHHVFSFRNPKEAIEELKDIKSADTEAEIPQIVIAEFEDQGIQFQSDANPRISYIRTEEGMDLYGIRSTPADPGDPYDFQIKANETSVKVDVWTDAAYSRLVDGVKIDSPLTSDGSAIKVDVTGAAQVSLKRTAQPETEDQALWVVIRNSTEAMSFDKYRDFINGVMGCTQDLNPNPDPKKRFESRLPFPGVNDYNLLKVATEVFLMDNCGVIIDFAELDLSEDSRRLERLVTPDIMRDIWTKYRAQVTGGLLFSIEPTPDNPDRVNEIITALDNREVHIELGNTFTSNGIALDSPIVKPMQAGIRWQIADGLEPYKKVYDIVKYTDPDTDTDILDAKNVLTLPYLDLIVRTKLGEIPVMDTDVARYYGILKEKLARPCLIELIWSYWHEEGMLVQTLNTVSLRFQNKRGPAGRDPLSRFDLDPLRPLTNLFWGYIQDEQHRLNLSRRVYEYDHHYGMTLYGKAVPRIRPVDSRSKFLEAFHNLLYLCSIFYKEDDDTTMIADGFPMLNALKEVHMLLAQGAHNQYGDLPWTARQEMMMQQWLLARPEMREFLRGRIMVPYPEGWMDCVDTMKMLQGWTDVTITHFNYLATFGERVLLSIRYGNWIKINTREHAANWARYWRPEIQGYIHNYRAVTGVDLSSELTSGHVDYTMPSVHLRRRLAAQVQR